MVVDWIWKLYNMAFEGVYCLRTRDLLLLFHYSRVKERGVNVRIIEPLACKCCWKNICGEY